ncbi:Uncharacterized protein dnl_25310 [Desulfonema limicola]|uniref:DUF8196 domain-containing protein n=1 Tax=Desulfonema limicola TaxID=45656 RepID=A0A975GGE5_9BACT|nr:hypothetical protein [Desulfonema limicola]QTA80235.1 Uncharacterized protein dnl_25310 [Desulfonema limicola]
MIALKKQMDALESRTDSLESVLGHFIVSTNSVLLRLERSLEKYKEEGRRERESMNKKWGDLANKMGTLVEDIAIPNIPVIAAKYFNIEDFDVLAPRIKKKSSKDNSRIKEFDVIAVSRDYIIINETKSKFRMSEITAFQETIKELFDFFPEYASKKIIPVFCTLYISPHDADYLSKNKIFAMCIKGEIMDIVNFDKIMPETKS